MADKTHISDQLLENVSGGLKRTVNAGDEKEVEIRNAPGFSSTVVGTVSNGTKTNATGKYVCADGCNWAEIDSPMSGWIKGSFVGFDF